MVKLSAFADEISQDLKVQAASLREFGLNYIEPRIVNGKQIIACSQKELTEAKKILDGEGLKVSSIASPVGKFRVDKPIFSEKERLYRAAETAHFLETDYVRIFTFYMPEGSRRNSWRSHVIEGLQAFLEVAYDMEIILLNENEFDVYCDTAARCKDIHDTIPSSKFRLNFDPGNFVLSDQDPINDCWNILYKLVEYCHIKDAVFESSEIVVPGKGDGRIPELVEKLKKKEYSGFYSLEPHLFAAGDDENQKKVYFKKALNAFKEILEQKEVKWE